MLDPLDQNNRPLLSALSTKRKRAFFIKTIESLRGHLWRPAFWIILFFGLWMLGVPAFFGKTATYGTSLAFFIGLIYLLKTDLGTLKLPNVRTLDHAIEKDSNMPRGNLSLIEDTLSNPQKHETRALWDTAQKQSLLSFKSLKTPGINLSLSREDPGALRFIAILLFISGLMVSGQSWQSKISNGMFPITPSFILSNGIQNNIWITPPDYTQIPQTHIIGSGTYAETLKIPEGSTIRIRLISALGKNITPKLHNGKTSTKMTYLDKGVYEIETTIEPGSRLSVTQMFIPRMRINYEYIIDMPPEISIDTNTEEPKSEKEDLASTDTPPEEPKEIITHELLDRAQIRFPLKVKDDYGVKDLRMSMNIDPMIEDLPLGNRAQETRLIMSQPNIDFKISPIYDMSWHTWAGLPVEFSFEAIDHKGQTTKLEPIKLILPERKFEHPMAKSLIAMRKRLAWDYKESFEDIVDNLESLLSAPDYFQNNPVIYLAIKTAAARLYYNDDSKPELRIEAASEVINLLWYAALTIEEGNLSMAMREMRDAQRALENAMRDPNKDQDDITALMDNLREKMQNYFTEMQREVQKRIENGEDFPEFSAEDFNQMISPDTLGNIMEQIEQALREGNEEKAQELMSQLQRMMEMMDPSMSAQLPPDMQMMQEGVNELQQLIEKQEDLRDKTEDLAQRLQTLRKFKPQAPPLIDRPNLEEMLKDFGFESIPPAPEQPKPAPQEEPKVNEENATTSEDKKIEQEALRYILGQLMLDAAEKLDEVPETMGKAELEMRGSEDKLGQNTPSGSVPHQEKAIEYLKQAQENLAQQFRQRMQQMIGIGLSGGQQRYDPLGRPLGNSDQNGQGVDSQVEVPDEAQKKRVDEILRELRERSADRNRPDDELQYFRRLLRQF